MKINNDKYLNISCLISLLELLELFIWDNIKNDLKPEYREDIDDQIKEKFDTYNLLNNEKKIELCSAIRKFISRYLSGKKSEIYCKGNKGLKQYLLNMEFWHLKFDDIEENIIAWFGDFDLKISQALKLYEYLGGDEFRLDDIINKYKQNNKEEEKKENEEDKDKDEDDSFDDFINDDKDEDSIKDSDEEVVKLEVYRLISCSVFTYMDDFFNDGVSEEDIKKMIKDVKEKNSRVKTTTEKTKNMKSQIDFYLSRVRFNGNLNI